MRVLKIAAMVIGLVLLSPSVHASGKFLNIVTFNPGPDPTIEDLVDDFIGQVARNIREDREAPEGALVESPTGYLINRNLIVDISKAPEDLIPVFLERLRRIYVSRERWRGQSYELGRGVIGITTDLNTYLESIDKTLARLGRGVEVHPREFCDYWLTKID